MISLTTKEWNIFINTINKIKSEWYVLENIYNIHDKKGFVFFFNNGWLVSIKCSTLVITENENENTSNKVSTHHIDTGHLRF